MPDSIEDLNHYWGETVIGRVAPDGVVSPVNVVSFQGERDSPTIIYSEPEDRHNYITTPFVKKDWVLEFPRLGVFNVEDSVVYIQRLVRRQWRKSYRNRLVQIYNLFEEEYDELEHNRYESTTPAVLRSVYSPEYFSFTDAYTQVADGKRLACAFTNEFYVCRKRWSEKPVIGYNNHFIGTSNGESISLKNDVKYLSDELSNYCEVRVVK